ncbi:MAG TPA: GDSL-type esterase/lipase family protein [Solirubrobacteraceae bacterium]
MSALAELEHLGRRLGADVERFVRDGKQELAQHLTAHPQPLFALLRGLKPVLVIHGIAIVTRHEDVLAVLGDDDAFGVDPYGVKMRALAGEFILGLEDSLRYEREVSIMRLAAPRSDVAALTGFLAQLAEQLVADAAARDGPTSSLTSATTRRFTPQPRARQGSCGPIWKMRSPNASTAAVAGGRCSGRPTICTDHCAVFDWDRGVWLRWLCAARKALLFQASAPPDYLKSRRTDTMRNRNRIAGILVLGLVALVPAASAAALPQYVALGDSYSSGVGTGVYYEEAGECLRSPDAYGPKVASSKGYTLSFQACAGAKTAEVNEKQLGTLSATTSRVTITIGGNDAGFGTVLTDCAALPTGCETAISEANTFIKNKLPGLLETTYKDISTKATTAKVIVLGYPKLFTKEGKTCGTTYLTSGKEEKLNETAELLDNAIKGRAEAAKFTYVNPTSAFESHEVCSTTPWLNGLVSPTYESYHPNIAGQAEFTTLIEAVF